MATKLGPAFISLAHMDLGSAPGELTWSPPGWNGGDPRLASSFPGYTAVTINNSGQAAIAPYGSAGQYWVIELAAATDYVLLLNRRYNPGGFFQGLSIHGGRNVVIIGGEIEIPGDVDLVGGENAREAIAFLGQTGIVHLEGVWIHGKPLRPFIPNTATTFQVENCRWEGVYMWNEDRAEAHSNTFLCESVSPLELRFDQCTMDYDNTGFALYDSTGGSGTGTWPGRCQFKRTNLRNSPTFAGGHQWCVSSNQTRIDMDQLWVETGFGFSGPGVLGPTQFTLWGGFADGTFNDGRGITTKVGDGKSPGSYTVFTNSAVDNIYGVGGGANIARVDYGVPLTGDFVPTGAVGTGYVSPGYV